MDSLTILDHFYPGQTPLKSLLLKHSEQVRDKALAILAGSGVKADSEMVMCGAMLHDTGIFMCHAPDILCEGSEPYITHGIIGGRLLRKYGAEHGLDLEVYARICERHTGTGITMEEIREQNLPLPPGCYIPETVEEKLVCLADKFYSKSGDMKEKSMERIRKSMRKFGPDSICRFDAMCRLFHVTDI